MEVGPIDGLLVLDPARPLEAGNRGRIQGASTQVVRLGADGDSTAVKNVDVPAVITSHATRSKQRRPKTSGAPSGASARNANGHHDPTSTSKLAQQIWASRRR